MNIRQQHIELAQTLPKRLLDFFRKYPPPALTQGLPAAPKVTEAENPVVASNASSADPNAPILETPSLEEPVERPYRNPFQPHKHHQTGRWHSPIYGLRRQAEIVKLAEKHGVVSLLPYTIKLPGERAKRREQQGLRVKGTGIGEKVKGKAWERTLKSRLEVRRKAMEEMPTLIAKWKQLGHGKGWKKWPSGKASR